MISAEHSSLNNGKNKVTKKLYNSNILNKGKKNSSRLKSESELTRGRDRGDTCHLSFLDETLPD